MTRNESNKKFTNSNLLKPDFYPMNHFNVGNDVVRCFLALQIIGTLYIYKIICMYVHMRTPYIKHTQYISVALVFLLLAYYHPYDRWMVGWMNGWCMDDSVHLDCTSTSLIELRIIDATININNNWTVRNFVSLDSDYLQALSITTRKCLYTWKRRIMICVWVTSWHKIL